MLIADIGIVRNAMTILNFEPDLVDEITELLLTTSDDLHGQNVTTVSPGWFGGSGNAHRIGVNTTMAHQAVEEEFDKLASALREYSTDLTRWADEVRDIDSVTSAQMSQRQSALEQINTSIVEITDQTSSDTMGDGQYSEPPATDGSTS